jgi:sugar phosphate isomerase/epimerase
MSITLTGFADEISPRLGEQLDTLAAEGLTHLELRSVDGINVAELTDAQVARTGRELAAAGVRVSAIGSPIGKVSVEAPAGPELERMRRVAGIAATLGTGLVRVFSFFIPPGQPPERYRTAVLDRMAALAAIAEAAGLTLAHENEKDIYGDRPQRCADLIAAVGSPALRATFDAANFVQCGVRPHTDAYPLLRPALVYLQVKDAIMATGEVVLPGQGDGQLRETFAALAASGFTGFVSLEPHLAAAGRFGGFSGPQRFAEAARALKALLAELDMEWA